MAPTFVANRGNLKLVDDITIEPPGKPATTATKYRTKLRTERPVIAEALASCSVTRVPCATSNEYQGYANWTNDQAVLHQDIT